MHIRRRIQLGTLKKLEVYVSISWNLSLFVMAWVVDFQKSEDMKKVDDSPRVTYTAVRVTVGYMHKRSMVCGVIFGACKTD